MACEYWVRTSPLLDAGQTAEVACRLAADELAGGNVMFAATGVTSGDFLKGVRFTGDGARSHSIVMRSRTGTVRYIETVHRFTRSPNYGW